MKLHDNQLRLIHHLVRFNTLDYLSCLEVLDTNDTGDRVALSYIFRPLTKNDYIAKNRNGIVTVLKKGRDIFPSEKRLISEGSNTTAKQRVLQVSQVAALMEKNGAIIIGELPENELPHFIPSACWRNIAQGVLSTTRFVGILLAYGKKYAVYDIGDGKMEWQLRAESSLFYTKYGSYETKADGMILICDDDKRDEIAENIIRQTMWSRKTLLKEKYAETNKPVRYSRSPIKLRKQYRRVYLTTPEQLQISMKRIYTEEEDIANSVSDSEPLNDREEGDRVVWPVRYFINPAYDILKFVYFFSTVKSLILLLESNDIGARIEVQYAMILYKEDTKILRMYPDVVMSERVTFYLYQS